MIEQKQLLELGLTENEARTYLELLEYGPQQAGTISKKTGLNRTTVYQILDNLITKGLVSFTQKGKIKVFEATSAKRLLTLQQEKVRLASSIIPQLEKLSAPSGEEVTVHKGRQGIKTILNEILESKEYVSFGSGGQFLEMMGHDFILYQKEKKERKIKSRVILGKSSKGERIVTEAYADFRFIDDKYMTPTTTWVYNDKVAIVVWAKVPIATLIKSKDLAKAYNSYFEILWKSV